jgi:inosine-uridine nucleoside N-ribohydrolase
MKSGADAPEATGLMRSILADQPDHSVTIVSVGFLTNLARLLDSACDEVSNLPGSELVRRKVRLYVMMGGAFSEKPEPEYNIHIDAEASRKVLEEWPTPIIASGFEIGLAVTYPAESIQRDFNYTPFHPVAEAYRNYLEMPYDRPTWDLTAVLHAVRPDRNYFGISESGVITLGEKAVTQFEVQPEGRHQFLTLDAEQAIRVRELFVEMVSSPPLD